MKKLIAMAMMLVMAIALMADNVSLNNAKNGFKVVENSDYSLKLKMTTGTINFNKISTDNGDFVEIAAGNYKVGEIGSPALPIYSELIEAPKGAKINAELVNVISKNYKLSELGYDYMVAPMQPSYSKSENPANMFHRFSSSDYSQNMFYGEENVSVTKMGTMRGADIAKINVTPIKYNPVTGEITVIESADIKVSFVGGDLSAKAAEYSPYFEDSFNKLINYKEISSREDLTTTPVTYLIMASDALQGNAKLQEFIDWKKFKGYNVVVNYVPASATYTTNDTWVEDQYNNLEPKPSFLLIVGDMNGTYTVQTKTSGLTSGVSASDLPYGVMGTPSVGNHVPSIYVGRFSVRSEEELAAQVDKTIWYERDMFVSGDLSYLENAMGVAGADSGHQATYGNPHILYAMDYYFNDTYLNPVTGVPMNINGIPYLNGGSGQASNIVNHVSEGVAYYNYTAHGSNNSFGDPSFTISNINSLNNDGKYGLIIGNCCLTGSFGDAECFGEAWLNVPNKGSIGFIGASASTYWDEDLAMGVGEPAVGNQTPVYSPEKPGMVDGLMMMNYPTQAGVKHVGLLAVDEMSSSRIMYYWEAYHLFGDPSISIQMGVPNDLEVAHLPTVTPGVDTYEITTQPRAYVAMKDPDGIIKGVAIADESGLATITFAEPYTVGPAELYISAPFAKPYTESIPVVPLTGPYPVKENVVVNNPVYGQSSTIDLSIRNVGVQSSNNTIATISSESEYITISNDNADFGSVAPDEVKTVEDAFELSIVDGVADQTEITVALNIENDATKATYDYNFKFKVDAPSLAVGNISIDDSTGDNDGMLDPGETANISIPVNNNGHAAVNGIMTISSTCTYVTITNTTFDLNSIEVGTPSVAVFEVIAAVDTPVGTPLPFNVSVEAGMYDVSTVVGSVIGLTMEGFESGSFSALPWEFGANNWVVTNTTANNGTYSAQSIDIDDSELAEMNVELNFLSEGYVRFSYKVSSENNYDYLKFFINDEEQDKWCGDIEWAQAEFEVPAGTHTLRWIYSKDTSVSNGEDCAWVDDIETTGSASSTVVLLPPTNLTLDIDNLAPSATLNWSAPAKYVMTFGKPDYNHLDGKGNPLVNLVPIVSETAKNLIEYKIYKNNAYLSSVAAGTTTYIDIPQPNTSFAFYVTAIYPEGESAHSNEVVGSVSVDEVIPSETTLAQNYPNPFNPVTNISFFNKNNGNVKLSVFNVQGELVATLVNGNFVSGLHTVNFDASALNSGVYYYRLTADNKSITRKMILVK
ncbi:MAG: T9SS type A sorting domain-containing protein [Candidatus Delongbacteria bacterium]|nr:T9SS type A sorting domain-containing protein [Candidatus Delongbacteria bacterium]MBN2834518.1 T9SS type A sorting domain-containing protein [Candidatus Delongbacteria bacterium]